jgi:hypothetical protein
LESSHLKGRYDKVRFSKKDLGCVYKESRPKLKNFIFTDIEGKLYPLGSATWLDLQNSSQLSFMALIWFS